MFKLSLLLFFAVGTGMMALGLLYLASNEFMPYHAEAIQASWTELDANYRGLFLGFLRGLGGGALVAGYATSHMAVAGLWKSATPFHALLPIVATGYFSLLCYATYTVQTNTPGNPPLALAGSGLAVAIVASILLLMSGRRGVDG